MINRLSIPEGIPFPERGVDLHLALGEIVLETVENGLAIVTLTPGEYDITPTIWTQNTHNHQLLVLDNGEGAYRALPKDRDVGTLEYSQSGQWASKEGGRTINLNKRQPIAVVSGGHPHKKGINIFELLLYRSS